MQNNGYISFDTVVKESGEDHVEGCLRLHGEDWKVFYFTHRHEGKWWSGDPIVKADAVFQSGIRGVNAIYSRAFLLNKSTIKESLSHILRVPIWYEVQGPDSINLK